MHVPPFVCVCAWGCVHVWLGMCMACTCVCAPAHAHAHACMQECMCACTRVYVCRSMYKCVGGYFFENASQTRFDDNSTIDNFH